MADLVGKNARQDCDKAAWGESGCGEEGRRKRRLSDKRMAESNSKKKRRVYDRDRNVQLLRIRVGD